MIVNLTPHPLHIYPPDCPEQVDPDTVAPQFTVRPDGPPARIVETTLGTSFRDCFDTRDPAASPTAVAVEGVEYGYVDKLPPADGHTPPRTFYVVSLVVALAARGRPDLLVPYRQVRNLAGAVIGCRQLARPC